jgi:hypothetical protein
MNQKLQEAWSQLRGRGAKIFMPAMFEQGETRQRDHLIFGRYATAKGK